MDKGGRDGKQSRPKKSSDENGKGPRNQPKSARGENRSKPQYAPKPNAKEAGALNDQTNRVEDATDEQLLNEAPSNDPQQLQSDLAYWQTRVSFRFDITEISGP